MYSEIECDTNFHQKIFKADILNTYMLGIGCVCLLLLKYHQKQVKEFRGGATM